MKYVSQINQCTNMHCKREPRIRVPEHQNADPHRQSVGYRLRVKACRSSEQIIRIVGAEGSKCESGRAGGTRVGRDIRHVAVRGTGIGSPPAGICQHLPTTTGGSQIYNVGHGTEDRWMNAVLIVLFCQPENPGTPGSNATGGSAAIKRPVAYRHLQLFQLFGYLLR